MAEAARDPWNAPAGTEALRALLPADHPALADRSGPRPTEFAPGASWVTLIDLPSVPRGTILQLLRYRTWVDWGYEMDAEGYEFSAPGGAVVGVVTERWQGRMHHARFPTMSVLSWREALVATLVVPVGCSLALEPTDSQKLIEAVTMLAESS